MKIIDGIICSILLFFIIIEFSDFNKSEIEPLFWIAFLIFIPLTSFSNYYHASKTLIKGLKKEEYQLLKKNYKILNAGPFSGRILSSSSVFEIKLKDSSNNILEGWACTSGGLISSKRITLLLKNNNEEEFNKTKIYV